MSKKIILASRSPGRKEVLEMIGLEFEIQTSNYEEDMTQDLSPAEMVETFSLGKTQDVASRNPNAIVIGADTVVVFKNEIMGKPKDSGDALRMLHLYNGNIHKVLTGYTIIDSEKHRSIARVVETEVKFRNLDDSEIEAYVATDEPLGKAGSYTIQSRGSALIEWIKGDVYNVIGLPVGQLVEDLKQFGIEVLKS